MIFIKLQLDYGSNIGYVPLDVIQDPNENKNHIPVCWPMKLTQTMKSNYGNLFKS